MEPQSDRQIKRRRALTDLERRNIRKYNAENPGRQQALRQWFKESTGRELTQGQISSILSSKYAYLDSSTLRPSQLSSNRNYKSDWPDLEAALFEWQQHMQKRKATITGDILKAKAAEIWSRLPQYRDLEALK